MAYNWQIGAAPGVPEPRPVASPRRRAVGGRPVGRGVVRTADGRTLAVRPPGTRLYVPGYLDDETEHRLMRQQLGIVVPVAAAVPLVAGLFGKKSQEQKYMQQTRADGHSAGSGSVGAVAALASAAKDSRYPARRQAALQYLRELASGKGYNGKAYVAATPAVQGAAQQALASLGQGVPGPVVGPVSVPAPSPVTLVPQIPGVVPVPITYTPSAPAGSTEMVPPTTSGLPSSGFDMKSLLIPGAIGVGLLLVLGGFGRRR
jgi:hypothetical protein